jgi:hypothetical protein
MLATGKHEFLIRSAMLGHLPPGEGFGAINNNLPLKISAND